MTNKEIAYNLRTLAELLELSGENRFRVGAYYNASRRLMDYDGDVNKLAEEGRLREIPGIGEGIAALIREVLESGSLTALEELKNKLPAGLLEMLNVPGVGPGRAHQLFYQLGIQGIPDLKKALQAGEVRKLKGFGPKTEEKLLKSLKTYESFQGVVILLEALGYAEEFLTFFDKDREIISAGITGSIRRREELVSSIDFLITANEQEGRGGGENRKNLEGGENRQSLLSRLSELPPVRAVEYLGDDELKLSNHNGFPVNIKIVNPRAEPAALVSYTGSAGHLKKLQSRARELGYSLTEKGLFRGTEEVRLRDENSLYRTLKLEYIIPELREDRGEIEAAAAGNLPRSVTIGDIKGELHTHSRYSDGAFPIREMVEAARRMGYQYLAVTDHSQSLKIAHGLSVDQLLAQLEEIDSLQEKYDDIRILKGIEVDIKNDGSLDYDDDILARLDLVIASIHTGFNQSGEQLTSRVLRAMENPHVRILAHPQGRILRRRKPYAVVLERVIEKAAATGTCLEINASPYRLDLDDRAVLRAKEAGVRLAINTDAHHINELDDMALGVTVARRGWLEKEDVLNCLEKEELLSFLGEGRK